MSTSSIDQLIDEIRTLQGGLSNAAPDIPPAQEYRCVVLPRLTWQHQVLENVLKVTLPWDLRELWERTSGLILFEDVTYGQWGLVVWSPDQALVRHQRYVAERPNMFQPGDLIIGEFLGDSDLLMIRCDAAAPDFGSVHITLPLDHRQQWYGAAPSLVEFIGRFLKTHGEKYWEQPR